MVFHFANRRQFLAASCSVASLSAISSKAFSAKEYLPEHTVDLTNGSQAKGCIVHIDCLVMDPSGKPASSVFVEIEQSCASGRSMIPSTRATAAFDSNFSYWKRAATDTDGWLRIKTIVPGDAEGDLRILNSSGIKLHVFRLKEFSYEVSLSADLLTQAHQKVVVSKSSALKM